MCTSRPAHVRSKEPGAPRQVAIGSETPGSETLELETLHNLGYLHAPGSEDALKGITHWVAADLSTEV